MNQNENSAPKRENFASRLGFLLVSAGCAIGIGNVWRFPTVAGQNGGGVFVLFYLIFLLAMGVPVLTMELAVGRAGHGTATQAYRALEKQGAKWHLHGYLCLFGCCMLMMYYTTVSGWMLSYFFKFLTGAFSGLSGDAVSGVFGRMLESPGEMGGYMALTVVLGFAICSFGLQNGVERITKGMMCALIVLIAVLAVHSFTLSGAKDGLAFFLLPDWGRAVEQGIGSVLVSAMNQAFFTLSLGIGAMEIFGSYMNRDHTLTGEAVRICALDTFVAVSAGLIIFPACFSYGVSPDAGPSLIFITLPNVFTGMAGGRVWGTLFYWATDETFVNNGYSFIWFYILYFMAAYFRKYRVTVPSGLCLLAYLAASAAGLFNRMLALRVENALHLNGFANTVNGYQALATVIASAAMFLLFQNIRIRSDYWRRWVFRLAPLSFGVYLLHDSDFTRALLWQWVDLPRFGGALLPSLAYLAGAVLLVAAAGYAVDAVYQRLYRLLHLPALETKLDALTARILQNIVGSEE